MDFSELKDSIQKDLSQIKNSDELKNFSITYLGKKGKIRTLFSELKNVSLEERKKLGQEINEFAKTVQNEADKLEQIFKEREYKLKEAQNKINLDLPGEKIETGHLHPLTITRREIEDIFERMGFEVVEGLEIEDEWHNFDSLNIPEGHPARDALSLGKTLYLKNGGLLRSHTSAAQTRYMQTMKPPIRIVIPGRTYRSEKIDASHEINFYQIEGLMVAKNVSVANLKAVMQVFLKKFFEKETIIRLRPSYFPFTEPSFEIDMTCLICNGKGCAACKHSGWVEILGSGMVHPNVIKNGGLDPQKYKGFAFGMSIDRLTMMKYKIDDIRWFHSGNLKFLKQF
ncbi:MAG TPA: phenylalanine--tRNA ligase subunit alpha [Candidatus Paceibacterota bacterium]|nr:phenylalanine--tRNA ligase subunit alpha [Candidatus Pacearchaeota archaeon]HPC30481.1 phenylalanine--tRNA ligase subunit alpha [Candidatus Pacearchaeota archaeon]HQG09218.1 phenylalanine--tRNA ligase subunit alpha [Candidatus Pacearchaeota archaeon]HRR94703.1 phenylalanine--tRNA ligase subunit alpha [Candidatus Paceibacterota bacterium]HRU20803.1 phenylalanine--tRNA ligase subunit alpha [Candidatus Paceibacterota bacterium]